MSESIEVRVELGHALTDLAGCFLSVDNRFCEVIGRERSDIVGRTILDVTVERDRPLNADKLQLLRDRNKPFVIRKSYLRGDGSSQAVENHVSLLTDGLSGSVISASVYAIDSADDVMGLVRLARSLLLEQCRLSMLGPLFTENGWSLLLAAYVLEAEGAPLLVEDLCTMIAASKEACLLQVWSLVAAGLFVLDGTPESITNSGVRLSVACMRQIEEYLVSIRSDSKRP